MQCNNSNGMNILIYKLIIYNIYYYLFTLNLLFLSIIILSSSTQSRKRMFPISKISGDRAYFFNSASLFSTYIIELFIVGSKMKIKQSQILK